MTAIEVFADVCCPFTHLGLRRLVEHRSDLGRHDVVLRVRAWPLELVNGAPLDPHFVAEEVDELRAQVAPDLFVGFDVDRFPETSMPALALAASAYDRGAACGEQVSLALRQALFEEGADISEAAVLGRIAASAGVDMPNTGDRAAVLADWREGQRRGVMGSPHFFVGGESYFCPTLDIARVDGKLTIAVDRSALTEFLERCFSHAPPPPAGH